MYVFTEKLFQTVIMLLELLRGLLPYVELFSDQFLYKKNILTTYSTLLPILHESKPVAYPYSSPHFFFPKFCSEHPTPAANSLCIWLCVLPSFPQTLNYNFSLILSSLLLATLLLCISPCSTRIFLRA